MKRIDVDLGERSYPILIGPGLLEDAVLLRQSITARQVLVVSNETIAPLYLASLETALGGRDLGSLVLPDGEQYKNLDSFALIIDRLVALSFHRDACIVALGGGVVGDLAGFAAACYQRGIDFVQIPTTLLAQVDSSVGGKTAVNHPEAKNMIGAFHQPLIVLTDTDTLASLPPRELSAGLAEVIKYGLIEDAGFFAWLEDHMDGLLSLDPAALSHAIARCCEIKAQIVAEDEHERGRRALLNLGHTFGHAIEALGGYGNRLHGEAVAIGMRMAAEASVLTGSIEADAVPRICALLERARLPVDISGMTAAQILDRMSLDKKADSKGLRLVLLEAIGRAVVVGAPEEALLTEAIRRSSKSSV